VTDTINALQNDWAAYVCRNDLRQRVRGFVRDALARLIANPQVEAVVVNAHSQGTVVAFDVLSDLPGDIRKVKRFLTSGSPLRKYVDLYSWGPDGGSLLDIPWTNFYDPKDPVADPLQPAVWRPGQEVGSAPKSPTLFQSWPDNSATSLDMRIDDRQVDNVTNTTASGLRAHDYWDNRKEVVPTIAEALTASARQIQPVTV
jgi:pimeloyl-ACP methyl ester carboxylesterase